jgi:phage baseplate assembly protein V
MAGMLDDILRTQTNLIRYGTVVAVIGKRVAVNIGDVLTRPLPWAATRAGKTATWSPPDIGEQVMVLSPNGNIAAGVVFPALFSDHFPAPADASPTNVVMAFGDGAVLLYDQATHLLKATLPGGGAVELSAPGGFTFKGHVQIEGSLKTPEDIHSDADVLAGNISLRKHPHDKVKLGTDISGLPLP